MTADKTAHGEDPGSPPARVPADPPDAGHLDEDAEACEDPVHSGDARHQHDLHAGQRAQDD